MTFEIELDPIWNPSSRGDCDGDPAAVGCNTTDGELHGNDGIFNRIKSISSDLKDNTRGN